MTTPWVRAVWRGAWPSPAEQSPPAPPPRGKCVGPGAVALPPVATLVSFPVSGGGIRDFLVMGEPCLLLL